MKFNSKKCYTMRINRKQNTKSSTALQFRRRYLALGWPVKPILEWKFMNNLVGSHTSQPLIIVASYRVLRSIKYDAVQARVYTNTTKN